MRPNHNKLLRIYRLGQACGRGAGAVANALPTRAGRHHAAAFTGWIRGDGSTGIISHRAMRCCTGVQIWRELQRPHARRMSKRDPVHLVGVYPVRAGRLAARLQHVQAAREIGQENIRRDGRPKCPGRGPGQTGIDPTPIVKEPGFTSDWYQSRRDIQGVQLFKIVLLAPLFYNRIHRPVCQASSYEWAEPQHCRNARRSAITLLAAAVLKLPARQLDDNIGRLYECGLMRNKKDCQALQTQIVKHGGEKVLVRLIQS